MTTRPLCAVPGCLERAGHGPFRNRCAACWAAMTRQQKDRLTSIAAARKQQQRRKRA